jgi:hypothetical protein
VAVDGAEDLKIAGRKRYGTDRRSLEARSTGLDVGHRMSVRGARWPEKAAVSTA